MLAVILATIGFALSCFWWAYNLTESVESAIYVGGGLFSAGMVIAVFFARWWDFREVYQ
jgi:hypothetical protein